MIGNEQEALFIRDWYADRMVEDPYGYTAEDGPDGWRYLGRGAYRAAFLGPSGAVYKVQHTYTYSYQSNEGEVRNLRNHMLTKLPKTCRLPRYTLYGLGGKAVTAMEHLPALLRDVGMDSPYFHLKSEVRGLVNALTNVFDLHHSNIAVDTVNHQLVPIDLGG